MCMWWYVYVLYVVDTCLPSNAAFSHHLVARTTPVADIPSPSWSSDDSETENLISAVEQLIYISNQPQAQPDIRPSFAEPTSEEPGDSLKKSFS